jgi:hypothetical protein
MAVIADGYAPMARMPPAVEGVSHHMTVQASPWIVREIGKPASIKEGVSAQTHQNS